MVSLNFTLVFFFLRFKLPWPHKPGRATSSPIRARLNFVSDIFICCIFATTLRGVHLNVGWRMQEIKDWETKKPSAAASMTAIYSRNAPTLVAWTHCLPLPVFSPLSPSSLFTLFLFLHAITHTHTHIPSPYLFMNSNAYSHPSFLRFPPPPSVSPFSNFYNFLCSFSLHICALSLDIGSVLPAQHPPIPTPSSPTLMMLAGVLFL